MRDSKEKKEITKSLKMTRRQCESFEKQADLHGMSFSSYIITAAAQGDAANKAASAVAAQNIQNEVRAIAEEFHIPAERTKKLEKEVKALWSSLK